MRLKLSTKAAVEEWLDAAKRQIGLQLWQITVADDAASDDAWADIEPHSTDTTAVIRIGAGFEAKAPEEQRLILTHELTHLFIHPLDQYASHLETQHGAIWWGTWYPGYNDHLEAATERIAKALAPRLPDFELKATPAKIERR
jgi:hypothetical protein